MRCHVTPVRMAIFKMTKENKYWQRRGEKGTLVSCWWECKLVPAIMENSREAPQKTITRTTI